MSVNWIQSEKRLTGLTPVEIKPEVLFQSEMSPNSYQAIVDLGEQGHEGALATVDMRTMIAPLGEYGRVLYSEGEFKRMRELLVDFWALKDSPKIVADVLDLEGERQVVRTKITKNRTKLSDTSIEDIFKGVNASFEYDKTVVGAEGDHLEIQFLNMKTRVNVRPGDAVDCGLFMSINGSVRVSPGINRLVCTNGLTETFHLWRNERYEFSQEFLDRAVQLATWLGKQADAPITHMRDLNVVLRQYPKGFVSKFYEKWSARMDMKELTFFDVIDDLTRSVNNTLRSIRYNVLALSEPIRAHQSEGRCPICQHHIVES